MYRTVKQARLALNFFIVDKCEGRKPHAINTEKFVAFIVEAMDWDLRFEIIPNMKALRGMVLRDTNKKRALILVSGKNNICWKRFTAIKESCHLFLEYEENDQCDNALEMAQALVLQTKYTADFLPNDYIDGSTNDFNKTLLEQIKATISESTNIAGIDESAVRKALHEKHEAAAVVAAIEIMIPEYHREELLNKSRGLSLKALAKEFKVPALILEYRLNGWSIPINKF